MSEPRTTDALADFRASPAGKKYEADKAVELRQLMERRAKIPRDELARRDREFMQKLTAWASGNVARGD